MYTVRQLAYEDYQVANFTDYSEPIAVYRVRGARCSCPARNPCKHQKLVSKFKKLDVGAYAFELTDTNEVRHSVIPLLTLE